MLTQVDSITTPSSGGMSFITWRSISIPRWPPHFTHVYLLHFEQPIGNAHTPHGQARHYIGVSCNLDERLRLHQAGQGARIMAAVANAGIGFQVARLWRCETYQEGRELERRLKRRKEGPRLCPICQQKPLDGYTMLHRGMWPFHLFEKPRRMKAHPERPLTFGRAFAQAGRLI